MAKQYILLGIMLVMTSGLIATTDADAKKQATDILGNMVSGHNRAFGADNIYKAALDLDMWNNAISRMRTFVTTIIKENKSWGMKDSTLVKALNKITKAESDLVTNITITRGVLQSPTNVQEQIVVLNQIATDMQKIQSSLQSMSMSPAAKDEARLLLMKTAMFIKTTATKASKDVFKK